MSATWWTFKLWCWQMSYYYIFLRMFDLIGRKKEKEDLIGETWRNGRLDGVGKKESVRQREWGRDRERQTDRQTDGGGGRVSALRLVDSRTARCRASLTDGVSSSDSQTLSVVLRFNLNNNLQQSWNSQKMECGALSREGAGLAKPPKHLWRQPRTHIRIKQRFNSDNERYLCRNRTLEKLRPGLKKPRMSWPSSVKR